VPWKRLIDSEKRKEKKTKTITAQVLENMEGTI
jgi:hypothetical protein